MSTEQLIGEVIDALNRLSVPYMLTGSLASNFYGIPRATMDADFVADFSGHAVDALAGSLGQGLRLDPQASFETVTGTTRYVIRSPVGPFVIELFLPTDDPHDRERFRRRCRVTLLGRETYVPTVEDVIVTKLRWSRQGRRAKDLDDARNVMAVQRDRIDWAYVNHWCEQHDTLALLERLRTEVPPE